MIKYFPYFFLSRRYSKRLDYTLNIKTPRSFNEKIQWLKINDKNRLMTIAADKVAVRDYVEEKIGAEYLIPTHNIFESVDDIDFETLPNSFALKAAHGSGWNVICHNKSKLNKEEFYSNINLWANTDYYLSGAEFAYQNVKPRFVCEELILNKHGQSPEDYKIFCFNGKPEFILYDQDRFINHRQNVYDTEWNLMPFRRRMHSIREKVERPLSLDKMLELAKVLSADFTFARVDFYNLEGKIYFGEITFYPGNGGLPFYPSDWDFRIGELLELPKQ